MKDRVIPILLVVLILGGVVAGWVLLPDPVSVAFGFSWENAKTMPKLMALGLSAAIGVFGGYQAMGPKEFRKGGYIMMLIAAVVLGLLFFVNRNG